MNTLFTLSAFCSLALSFSIGVAYGRVKNKLLVTSLKEQRDKLKKQRDSLRGHVNWLERKLTIERSRDKGNTGEATPTPATGTD